MWLDQAFDPQRHRPGQVRSMRAATLGRRDERTPGQRHERSQLPRRACRPRVVGMHIAATASGRGIVVLGLNVALIGCASGSDQQSPLAAPTSPAAVAANLLQVCDHAQDAFRDGSANETEQYRTLSSELQGMIDTGEPATAEVLQPMVDAADAMAAAKGNRERSALCDAEHRAYDQLRRVCVQAGSQLWPE